MAAGIPIEFMSSQDDEDIIVGSGDAAQRRSISQSRSPRRESRSRSPRRPQSPPWDRDVGDPGLRSPEPSGRGHTPARKRRPFSSVARSSGTDANAKLRSSSDRKRHRSRSRSPRRSGAARSRSEPVLVKMCKVCEEPLESDQRQYKGCQMHYACGAKQAAAMTYFRANAEAKRSYEAVKKESPDKARQSIAAMENGSRASLLGMVTVLTSICRQRRLAMENKMIELDFKAFVSHWQGRGRSDIEAKAKWAKKTDAAMIACGRAFYKGKKLFVWEALPRVLANDDVILMQQSQEPSKLLCDASAARSMLKSPGGIQLGTGCQTVFAGYSQPVRQSAVRQSNSQPVRQSGSQAVSQSDSQAVKQSVSQAVKQSVSQAVSSQAVRRSSSQPVRQSHSHTSTQFKQSDSHTVTQSYIYTI